MTRKIDSTDSKSRWRDSPVVTPAEPVRDDANGDSDAAMLAANSPSGIDARRSLDRSAATFASNPTVPESATERPLSVEPQLESELDNGGLVAWLVSRRNTSLLVSVAIHLVLLIFLALMSLQLGGEGTSISLEGARSGTEPDARFESLIQEERPDTNQNQTDDQLIPLEIMTNDSPLSAVESMNPNPAPEFSQSQLAELFAGGSGQQRNRYMGGGSMAARTPEGREAAGEKYGATAESEMAVENALRWLANHQRSDGSWSFDLSLAPCDGRCRHSRKRNSESPTPSTAATGLALLAFLGAGYTQHTGPYQDVVAKGIYYLRNTAADSEFGYDWQQGGSMYAHGIALMALSEAMGMTKHNDQYDTDLLRYVKRGTRFTVIAQHESGSWGYTPGSPGDTTLTGWQILSLVGAQKAGIQTRSDTFARAKSFLMSVREEPGFQFGYRSPKAEPTTTAIALTLLMYLGQAPGHSLFDAAIDKIAENGPTYTNIYHDYYATMALHHSRHREWESWNEKLRQHLVKSQEREGHEAGSWHFKDQWGDVGGRLYTTAMCALTLEVYYRYLPLYDEPPDFPL